MSGNSPSLASLPSSIATSAESLKKRGISSDSFVFPAPVPAALSDPGSARADQDLRRKTLPSTSGLANPEPIPHPSCHPVTPPPFPANPFAFALCFPFEFPSTVALPGLLVTQPADDVVRALFVRLGIFEPDFASTHISHPV